MHLSLLGGLICDAGFALGTGMPWEYDSITLLGAFLRVLQHGQFWSSDPRLRPAFYVIASVALAARALRVIHNLRASHEHQMVFLLLAYVSMLALNAGLVSPILLNRRQLSTEGLSAAFIVLGFLGMVCGVISKHKPSPRIDIDARQALVLEYTARGHRYRLQASG